MDLLSALHNAAFGCQLEKFASWTLISTRRARGSFSFSAARCWCTKTVPKAARGQGSLQLLVPTVPPCSQPASSSFFSMNPNFAASPRWADGGCEARVRLRGKMNEFSTAGRSGGPLALPSPGGDPKVSLCPGLQSRCYCSLGLTQAGAGGC